MKSYSEYLADIFPGLKVQKISVDAGFTCPNRDGTISTGGCIYCRNDSFSPRYCDSKDTVRKQLEKGKAFFSRKYPEMKYLAYFQSYTGTYNKTIEELENLYREALETENIIGIVIGTRPDCISESTLELLSAINQQKPVFIELGAETSHDETLALINRNHTWQDVENSVFRIAEKGIHIGLHLIIGLPGESKDMIFETIDKAAKLPIETLKLHQLQILKGTPLLRKLEQGLLSVPDFTLQEYIEICHEIIKRIPDTIIIERFLAQSPPNLVVSPSWGLKNYEFMNLLNKYISKKHVD